MSEGRLTTDERKNKSRRDVIVRPRRPQITTIVESNYSLFFFESIRVRLGVHDHMRH
jgi:hypothetical protein